MPQRWTLSTVLLAIWHIFLCSCAGYGAFRFAFNLGAEGEWACLFGSIVFVCLLTILDRPLDS